MEEKRDKVESRIQDSETERSHTQRSDVVIPVVEENAVIGKEVIETGKIRIRKTVTEDTAVVNLPVINESYDITRVPVNAVHETPPPAVRYEGDTMIIPVVKEVTVMVKRYEVVEEVRITKKLTETPMMQEIKLRREHVDIERSSGNTQEQP
jgi:uncharacterized protein (TIGR02271 family)